MIINLKTMPSRKWVSSGFTVTILFVLFIIFTLAPSLNGLSSVDERGGRKLFGGYRITPKFCRATKSLPRTDPRSRGPTICMFNHECAQRQGEVVGACMDGFLFGACCQIPGDIDTTLIQQAQQTPTLTANFGAAQSYESYGSNVQNNDIGYLPYPTKQPVHSESSSNSGSGYYGSNEGDLESEADIDSNYNSNGDNAVESSYENNSGSVGPTSAGSNFDDEVSSYLPDSTVLPTPTQGQMYLPINFSSELPMLITSSPYDESYETFSGSSSERVPVVGSIITSNGIHHISNTIIHEQPINFNNGPIEEFTQSGITHPSADSVLLDEDLQFSTGYGPSTVYVPAPTQISSSTTASTFAKPTYQKPAFRPKPTAPSTSSTHAGSGTTSDEKYVLVQTITNDDKRPASASGMTTNDIESIESIILMLNDTKHGSHYDSTASPLVSASTETYKPSYNSPFIPIKPTARPSSTTNVVNKENFSSTSYFVSTTLAPPTRFSTRYPTQTSLIYSSSQVPSSTLRPPFTPITSTKRKPSPTTVSTTPKPTSVTVTKKVTTVTTVRTPSSSIATTPVKRQPPSTSYVTGPPTRRPVTIGSLGGSSSTIYLNDIKVPSTTPSSLFSSSYGTSQGIPSSTQKVDIEHVIQSKPISQEPTYIKIPATQRPDPTVIITPKPTVNLVTSSTWTQRPPSGSSTYTTPAPPALPSTSYIFNPIVTQRPGFVSSTPEYINLPPLVSNDFDDPGYYGQSSSQGPAYDKLATLAPGDVRPSYPGYYGPTPSYIGGSAPTPSVLADHVEEEIYTSPNDFVNFPPVRNPNLNTSATTSSVTSDFDVSTPAFVEDEILRDKMNLLVSKIVASLQNNFDNLAEVVDERNATVEVLSTVPPTRRPTSSPVATRRPTSGKPSSGKPSSGKPSSGKPSSGKPSSGKPSSSKPAQTQQPGARPTTIQQDASRPTTVSRPSSQTTGARPTQTSSRPSSSATKPSSGNRRPTTTKPPVKKPATKPSSTPPKRTTPKPTVIRRPTTKPTKRIATTTVQQDETEEEGSETDEEEDNTIPAEEIGENIEDSEEGSRKIQCGVRPLIKSGRIVGGKGARFGEWPWQVLVRESTWLGLFTKNKCGGVLITNRFVITAAHCQPGFLASLVAVFGEFDISGDLEVKRSVTKNVKEVIVHRQYDAATFENDLALLKLESPVHYDTHIVPICMPPDSSEFTGRMATVTGWGRLRYGGGVPSILQVVQVPVIENSVCQEMFNTAKHKKKILPSFLCAGYANGQKDSCEGDSGGPLVMQRDDGRWQLVGTVSHGVKCADPYLPGVYMRTTYYKPWLKSVTGVK